MSDPKIGNEVWLVPVGIFAAGFGAGSFRQLPAWAATLLVMAGAVLIFGVILYTLRRSTPKDTGTPDPTPKDMERLGAKVYALSKEPFVLDVSVGGSAKHVLAAIARRKRVPIDMVPVLALREYVARHEDGDE